MSLKTRNTSSLSGDEFTYIWIDLPDASFQETLDAKRLGNNLYQIYQIPFYAENLNQFDIVECKDIDEVKHEFVRVVKFSGYRTVHIEFSDLTTVETWLKYMHEIEHRGADWTNSGRYFSISIPPDVEFNEFYEQLQAWERQKVFVIGAVNIHSSKLSLMG